MRRSVVQRLSQRHPVLPPLALVRSGAAAAARGVTRRMSTSMLARQAAALPPPRALLHASSAEPEGRRTRAFQAQLLAPEEPRTQAGGIHLRSKAACAQQARQSEFGGEAPERPGQGRCLRAWPGRVRSTCLEGRTGRPARALTVQSTGPCGAASCCPTSGTRRMVSGDTVHSMFRGAS